MLVNGTTYHHDTDSHIIEILEWARNNRERLLITYGDVKTGQPWGNIEGYIGRSTGNIKIPLCIYKITSMGGGGILDHCIVKIEYSNKKNGGILYQYSHK